MSPAPPAFLARLRSHNRHAIGAGIAAGLAAAVLWCVEYFMFVLILLGLVTAARGDWGPGMPPWIPGTAFALAALLFLWGFVDHARRRFRPTSDRPIIGWHLFGEFLLLPVRLIFAIWGNFSAVRRLGPKEASVAWKLLIAIHQAKQARIGSLSLIEPDLPERLRLLNTLQLLGYIDLHRGEDDWFYAVCSPREPELRSLEQD